MRHLRLACTLVAIPLAATACGTASSSGASGDQTAHTKVASGSPESAQSYAEALLAKVTVPAGSQVSATAPSKALESLPESPALTKTPTVVKKFWTVPHPASDVYAWLKQHAPGGQLSSQGGEGGLTAGGTDAHPTTQYLAYKQASLPASIGVGYVYVTVISTGPDSSAVAAYALALAQPPRPAAEMVPPNPSKVVISWSLAPGGTPAEKILTGSAAAKLTKDFNAVPVETTGPVPCPMIPAGSNDVVVRFTAEGHTWKADIPACPYITVTRDGSPLPGLSFGKTFLADLKGYIGFLPQNGPIRASGGATPLTTLPSSH